MGMTQPKQSPPVAPGGQVDGFAVVYPCDLPSSIFAKRFDFEFKLREWIARFVSPSRVLPLLSGAMADIDAIYKHVVNAPTPMALGADTRRIYAHFLYGLESRGGWWVREVGFSIKDTVENISAAKKALKREQLEDREMERSAKLPPPLWKVYFNANDGSGDFDADREAGYRLVDNILDVGHDRVKLAAPAMKNPVGPDMDSDRSILIETGKAVVGAFVEGTGDIPGEKYLAGFAAGDGAGKVYSNAKSGSGWQAAGDVADLGLALAGAGPLAPLGATLVGSLYELIAANDAGRLTRVRTRLYWFYTCGLLKAVVGAHFDLPKATAEREIYNAGMRVGGALDPRSRYRLQVALLHYVATHNTTNSWSFQNSVDHNWVFPIDYQRNWSPETLARAFVWQFGRRKYLLK